MAGAVTGVGFNGLARRLSTSARHVFLNPALVAAVSAVLLVSLALRGYQLIPLAAYGVLAAGSVPLAAIDLVERRLPTKIIVVMVAALAALIAIHAAIGSDVQPGLRALAGAAVLGGFFLIVALVSGQLGAGDVRLAAVLGVALAWHSWSALLIGTVLGLVIGAVAGLVAIVVLRRSRHSHLPLGPALIAGALATIMFVGPGPA